VCYTPTLAERVQVKGDQGGGKRDSWILGKKILARLKETELSSYHIVKMSVAGCLRGKKKYRGKRSITKPLKSHPKELRKTYPQRPPVQTNEEKPPQLRPSTFIIILLIHSLGRVNGTEREGRQKAAGLGHFDTCPLLFLMKTLARKRRGGTTRQKKRKARDEESVQKSVVDKAASMLKSEANAVEGSARCWGERIGK